MGTPAETEEQWIHRLLEVGRSVVTELNLGVVLDRVLETACEVTGARYAALGVLNEDRTELAEFLTTGIDERERSIIGDLPRGRGILGVLIEHPEPLRMTDVGGDPRSYGFPAGHPVMRGFLGVPVVIRGETWGNLYLAEKQGGEFTERDERAAVILADWAAVAIDNARLYETSERRRRELERAVTALEATRDVAVAVGGEIELENVFELIAKRGRALVQARGLVIMLTEGPDLVVHAAAGHVGDCRGEHMPISASAAGAVLARGRPERIADLASHPLAAPDRLGMPGAQTELLVPMLYRGEAVGVIVAFDRGDPVGEFGEPDEEAMQVFAASAATALALARSVQADRLRSAQAAADAERARWARELHDETLQGLGGLRVLLSGALRRGDEQGTHEAMREAVGRIEREIANLRALITELRPAALDELGLRAAIDALLDRQRDENALVVERTVELGQRLPAELENAVYRLIQEALTNVVRHASATSVRVSVIDEAGALTITVQDDGVGFDARSRPNGFGLAGMRERVELAGGTLQVQSGASGTRVTAALPSASAPPRGRRFGSRPDQAPVEGVADEVGPGGEAELAVDVRTVRLDRPR